MARLLRAAIFAHVFVEVVLQGRDDLGKFGLTGAARYEIGRSFGPGGSEWY
jgi:hypothetical protein